MTVIDWASLYTQAEEASKPLPDGPYPVEVEKATAKDSNAGNPMISLELRIWDGPGTGRKLFTQLTLSKDNPTALMFFFRNLGAFGVDSNVLATQPSMDQLAQMLVGRKATANVNTRPYQGVDRNNVQGFGSAGPGVIQGAVQRPLGGGLGVAPSAVPLGGLQPANVPAVAPASPLGTPAMVAPVSTPSPATMTAPVVSTPVPAVVAAPVADTAPETVPTETVAVEGDTAPTEIDRETVPAF